MITKKDRQRMSKKLKSLLEKNNKKIKYDKTKVKEIRDEKINSK